MDPITSAILAALATGVAGMAGQASAEAGKLLIKDAYQGLKAGLRKKFGKQSPVDKAIEVLEREPDFKPNQETLAGRIQQVRAASDTDLLQLAQALTTALEQSAQGRAALAKYKIHIRDGQVGVAFLGYRVLPSHIRLGPRSRRRFVRKFKRYETQWRDGRWSEDDLACHMLPLIEFTHAAQAGNFRRSTIARFGVSS